MSRLYGSEMVTTHRELVLWLVLLLCSFMYSELLQFVHHSTSTQAQQSLTREGTAGAVTVRFEAWLVLL